jgi:MerR family transcriptional regulator, copper efflux regulator
MVKTQSKTHWRPRAAAATEEQLYKIGEVAKQTGVGIETLRFYERSGLLDRPARTEGGYRLYDAQALGMLEFIKRAQSLGFTLEEIKRIIAESRTGKKPCAEVRQIMRQRLAELDERLKLLQQHRQEVAQTLQQWEATGEAEGLFCGLIENAHVPASKVAAADPLKRRQK